MNQKGSHGQPTLYALIFFFVDLSISGVKMYFDSMVKEADGIGCCAFLCLGL